MINEVSMRHNSRTTAADSATQTQTGGGATSVQRRAALAGTSAQRQRAKTRKHTAKVPLFVSVLA